MFSFATSMKSFVAFEIVVSVSLPRAEVDEADLVGPDDRIIRRAGRRWKNPRGSHRHPRLGMTSGGASAPPSCSRFVHVGELGAGR